MFGAEPVLGEAGVARTVRIDGVLRSTRVSAGLYRVQVGEVGGDPAAELLVVADVAVAGDDDIDPGMSASTRRPAR